MFCSYINSYQLFKSLIYFHFELLIYTFVTKSCEIKVGDFSGALNITEDGGQ